MHKLLIILLLVSIQLLSFAQDEVEKCETEVSKKSTKLVSKALDELKIGNNAGAASLLEEALIESPENLDALWILAELNRKKTNRYRKESVAIESYKQIINLCPSYKYYYTYYYLGKMYYEISNWENAYINLELFLNSESEKIHDNHFEDAVDLSKYAKFYHQIYSKPVTFEPFMVNKISTADDEYLPSLSPDNDYIYFTRRKKIAPNSRVTSYGNASLQEEKFCVAKKTALNQFDVGAPMQNPFNEQSNEGGATLTIDNKELFYTRCIIQNKILNCDICYSKYEDGYWSDIVELNTEINNPQYWESMPSISSDGKSLYFVSDRSGGYGGYDIYRSTRNAEGKWSQAVNMGPSINTAGHEKSPFIHTDSQTLYFSSSDRKDEKTGEYFAGHMGLGGYDIFYTRLNDSNLWISPLNIGYPINSEDNDLGFFVSTDGEYGFFASNKIGIDKTTNANDANTPAPPWNIYSFKLYKEARPQKVLFVKGSLTDENTNEVIRDAKIEIKNVETKEIKEIPIDNNTGNYVFTMVMKSDYTMTVKKQDYTYVTKYIGRDDVNFSTPVSMDMELKQIEVGKTYNLDDIYFATDSDQLTETSIKVVDGFFEFLHDNPNVIIEIQGHTDNVGGDEYNLKLSQARAKTVYNLLIKLGIPSNQMSYRGYGENQAIADNTTEEGRAKNRRTVFLIISK
jgi:outer membrane protein OmpA-like peptidoglycan-associated protein/tetratricopeptide (TPR) repeat protein